jgi:hypothetical protein
MFVIYIYIYIYTYSLIVISTVDLCPNIGTLKIK